MITRWQAKLTASLNDKYFLFICATIRYSNQAATCQNIGLINRRCAVDIADNHQNFLSISAEKNKITPFTAISSPFRLKPPHYVA